MITMLRFIVLRASNCVTLGDGGRVGTTSRNLAWFCVQVSYQYFYWPPQGLQTTSTITCFRKHTSKNNKEATMHTRFMRAPSTSSGWLFLYTVVQTPQHDTYTLPPPATRALPETSIMLQDRLTDTRLLPAHNQIRMVLRHNRPRLIVKHARVSRKW